MHILLISPGFYPFHGHNAVTEATAGLAKALRNLKYEVTTLCPLLPSEAHKQRGLARRLDPLSVKLGDQSKEFVIFESKSPSGVNHVFLSHEDPTSSASPETLSDMDVFFCEAASRFVHEFPEALDVVHVHDVACALCVPMLKSTEHTANANYPILFTLYDLEHQGKLSELQASELGLQNKDFSDSLLFAGTVNPAAAAIQYTDVLCTNTVRLAADLEDDSTAMGLKQRAEQREHCAIGIDFGVDTSVWNPATDTFLKTHYESINLQGKIQNKTQLQFEKDLDVEADTPLCVWLIENTDSLPESLDETFFQRLFRNELQLIICTPSDSLPEVVTTQEQSFEKQLRCQLNMSEQDQHRLIAAADFLLLSTSSNHLLNLSVVAFRYGSIPVVADTSFLPHCVLDCDTELRSGSSFLFSTTHNDDVLKTLQRALAAYSQKKLFLDLQHNIMKTDLSWDRSARHYAQLYKELASAEQKQEK
ncbi:MAG: glycogen/starch synthase [Myxococcales bacterium]|nr:MAG: glycogen/starch synthase [Myxococcales bacterium]